MLPSGNDAAIVLAEGIGYLMYLEEMEEFDKIKEIVRIPVKIRRS